MNGIEGVILLVVIALAAIGLDLAVLRAWRAFRRVKGALPAASAEADLPSNVTAAPPPKIVHWMLAIESSISAGYSTVRSWARLAA